MESTSRYPPIANSTATRSRCSGGWPEPDQPKPGKCPLHAVGVVPVLGRPERDVVAEPLRLLVGIRMAADIDQQSRVVDRQSVDVGETQPVRDPQRDDGLPQHVLHRLVEAEVDAER